MADAVIEPAPVIEFYKKDVGRTLLLDDRRRDVEGRMANLVAFQRLAQGTRKAGSCRALEE